MSVPAEGVCQPACDVMDMTTVWMAQMRSVQRRLKRRKRPKDVVLLSSAAPWFTVVFRGEGAVFFFFLSNHGSI